MLAADKLQLQSALKQQATALKEKEFNLHHSNMTTVGTIAAVLAGLDITMFIEFNPPDISVWGEQMILVARFMKFLYYITIVAAFCANMIVVSQTTTLSVLGAGMALRGPDGSMMTATDGLYEERSSVFKTFGFGLACTVGSVCISVWLILHWEAALCCMIIVLFTCRTIWMNYKRVERRFAYDESQTVDFRDIMEGPANIQAVSGRRPPSHRSNRYRHNNDNNNNNSNSKKGNGYRSQTSFSSMEEGDSDDYSGDWQQRQQSQRLTSRNKDVQKRRGTSPHPELAIQTI